MPRPELPGAPGLPMRRAGLALAAAALTAAFVVRAFPTDLLARRIERSVARSTGLELHLGALGLHLSPLGPGVQATEVRLGAPGGASLRIDRLRIRPAWSLGWLLLRPAFRIGAELAGGSVDGTLSAGPAFAGEVGDVELEQLPVAALWAGAALGGRLDAALDLRAAPEGPAGTVALAARQGSATLPGVPMPLAFESLDARLALGEGVLARVEELSLAGPGVRARAAGEVGGAPVLAEAPLDLRVELEVEPAMRPMLQGLGVPIGPDGRASLRITGTAARPAVE